MTITPLPSIEPFAALPVEVVSGLAGGRLPRAVRFSEKAPCQFVENWDMALANTFGIAEG